MTCEWPICQATATHTVTVDYPDGAHRVWHVCSEHDKDLKKQVQRSIPLPEPVPASPPTTVQVTFSDCGQLIAEQADLPEKTFAQIQTLGIAGRGAEKRQPSTGPHELDEPRVMLAARTVDDDIEEAAGVFLELGDPVGVAVVDAALRPHGLGAGDLFRRPRRHPHLRARGDCELERKECAAAANPGRFAVIDAAQAPAAVVASMREAIRAKTGV